jgi:hypothetical protein
MFFRWRRIEDKEKMWKLYGWFTALVAGGSCFGIVSWIAWMLRCKEYYQVIYSRSSPNFYTDPQNLAALSLANRWTAAFRFTYAVEFLCSTAAQLMSLDHMIDFALSSADSRRKRSIIIKRIGMAAVVAGNTIGLFGNIASAVTSAKTADSFYAASAAHNAITFKQLIAQGSQNEGKALEEASVQMWCEVVVLLLVLTAFSAVGAAGLHLVRSKLRNLTGKQHQQSIASGRQVHMRIFATTSVIFCSFLLRTVFSTMFALANQLQDTEKFATCIAQLNNQSSDVFLFCNDCFNKYTHIRVWMAISPEFQQTVVLLSSPIALLVALWGMTSKRMLQQMKQGKQLNSPLMNSSPSLQPL